MKKKKLKFFDNISNIEDLNDTLLLQNILDKNGDINGNKVTKKYLDSHLILKQYLINRYIDSNSISETIYRIKNNIEIRPICLQCGNPVNFVSPKQGFSKFCCASCATSNELTKQKLKQTNLEKYGVEHNWQNKEIRQKCLNTSIDRYGNCNNFNKIKQTNLEKYGVEYPIQNEDIANKLKMYNIKTYGTPCIFSSTTFKEKIKNTLIEKYGVDNPAKSNIIKAKIQQTNLEKYGSISPLLNKDIRQKTIITQFNKYGSLYVQSDKFKYMIQDNKEINNKKYNTRKRNHTFNTSKIEQQFKEYLEQNFPNDFEYQYKSELYPFNCDFYIKSLDLYIEIQGSWTHGGHPFDENNQEDIDKLNLWKSKNSKFYNNAIGVWTKRDINKRNIANENNLNYLEIFSNNIDECINIINKYVEIKYN